MRTSPIWCPNFFIKSARKKTTLGTGNSAADKIFAGLSMGCICTWSEISQPPTEQVVKIIEAEGFALNSASTKCNQLLSTAAQSDATYAQRSAPTVSLKPTFRAFVDGSLWSPNSKLISVFWAANCRSNFLKSTYTGFFAFFSRFLLLLSSVFAFYTESPYIYDNYGRIRIFHGINRVEKNVRNNY